MVKLNDQMFQINVLKFQGHWVGRVGKMSGHSVSQGQ